MAVLTGFLRAFVWGAFLLLGLPGPQAWLPAAAGQSRLASSPDPVYTQVEQMPELYEGGGKAALTAAVQQGVVLPFGTPLPAAGSGVVVRFVVGTIGDIADVSIVQGLSPAVDEAVRNAVRRLPQLRSGRQGQRYVRVAFTLTITEPGISTPDQRREADTRWQQTALRLPGEADTTFLRRVLPLTYAGYAHKPLAYAWRPGAFGKQLFFSVRGDEANDGGTDLFVLDPFQPNTYAVQVLRLESMGDLTDLASLFFTDTNGDGKKELLALVECSLKGGEMVDGEWLPGRATHYRTDIWHYTGLSSTGRPQYEQAPERPDLDELSTAAAVRQALARPLRSPQTKAASKAPKRK